MISLIEYDDIQRTVILSMLRYCQSVTQLKCQECLCHIDFSFIGAIVSQKVIVKHDVTRSGIQRLMPRQADAETPKDLVERIAGLLTTIDETGDVPDEIKDRPGEFLRELYEAWYKNGGKAGGKPRNSIRRMRNEWLVRDKHVRSLHPKLTGQVKFDRQDGRALVELFLSRWEYVGSRRKDDAVTLDGYVPFISQNLDRLIELLLDSMFRGSDRENRTTILLPTSETVDAEVDTPIQDSEKSYLSLIREADALITISSRRTVLGPSPAKGMRLWWYLIRGLSKDDETKENLFIWVIDIGSRQVEDEGAFAEYLNAGLLALHFSALASFSSELDQEVSNVGPLGRRLSVPDDQQRLSRWQWLKEHAAIVIRTRGDAKIEDIYREDDAVLNTLRLKDLGLSAEHVLPRTVPSNWAAKLEKFYDGFVADLADANLTAFYKRQVLPPNRDVLYLAAANRSNPSQQSRIDADEEAISSLDVVELPSPGENYDDAHRLIYFAARYRLSKHENTRDEKLAIAYLHRLGFEVLRANDFLKLFGKMENIDDY